MTNTPSPMRVNPSGGVQHRSGCWEANVLLQTDDLVVLSLRGPEPQGWMPHTTSPMCFNPSGGFHTKPAGGCQVNRVQPTTISLALAHPRGVETNRSKRTCPKSCLSLAWSRWATCPSDTCSPGSWRNCSRCTRVHQVPRTVVILATCPSLHIALASLLLPSTGFRCLRSPPLGWGERVHPTTWGWVKLPGSTSGEVLPSRLGERRYERKGRIIATQQVFWFFVSRLPVQANWPACRDARGRATSANGHRHKQATTVPEAKIRKLLGSKRVDPDSFCSTYRRAPLIEDCVPQGFSQILGKLAGVSL